MQHRCVALNVDLCCHEIENKPHMEKNIPRSPFTCHVAKVMSDLCQEGPNNDVTTGSRKSAGISRPSGVLWTNQIHKNGCIDIWDEIMALARLAT